MTAMGFSLPSLAAGGTAAGAKLVTSISPASIAAFNRAVPVFEELPGWKTDSSSARRFEDLHGGLGIMADDAMAGIYGNLLLQACLALAPAGWLA